MARKWVRWMPAVAVPAVIAAGVLLVPLQANAEPQLPSKTPQEVLTLAAGSTVTAFSGTVKQTSDLGLPSIPSSLAGAAGSSAADLSSALTLLTSSHTATIAVDGPQNLRVQVQDTLAETDVVRNGDTVWLYSSSDNTATKATLPSKSAPEATPTVPSPSDLAAKALSAIDPSTTVTLGKNVSIAGRTAYDLILTPKASGTLIGSVSIAVDSATGLPLSFAVQAQGQKDPAFSVAFSSLSLDKPAASEFSFTPPSGAKVKQQDIPKPDPSTIPSHDGTKPATSGSGWATVIEVPASEVPSQLDSSLLKAVTSSVSGGRLLSTSLVNVFFADDGRVFAGSVPLSALQAAAGA